MRASSWLATLPDPDQALVANELALDPAIPKRPALIVVDVTYAFTGWEGQSLEEAVAEFVTAAGPVAWEAMPKIRFLIDAFRAARHPVIFTRSAPMNTPHVGRSTKSKKVAAAMSERDNTIPPCLAPGEREWVLEKARASAFFQTPLPAYLVSQSIDVVVVCGVSTSGCVRATVSDSFSHGYDTWVVDDACFDRSRFLHNANLYDMQRHYGSVLSAATVAELILQPAGGREATDRGYAHVV